MKMYTVITWPYLKENKWFIAKINYITVSVLEVVLTFQIFEWLDLIYIIVTQKNRSCNEIFFDTNHENVYGLDEEQLPDQIRRIKFRKNEKRIGVVVWTCLIVKILYDIVQLVLEDAFDDIERHKESTLF